MNKSKRLITAFLAAGVIGVTALTGCAYPSAGSSAEQASGTAGSDEAFGSQAEQSGSREHVSAEKTDEASSGDSTGAVTAAAGTMIDVSELYTERDLAQTADLSGAVTLTVSDGQTVTISEEGTYVLQGTAENATVCVEADTEAKVQIVLDGVSITNESAPCIYVKSADKVFVTTTDTENSLSVTGTFEADGSTNLDGVIFSRADLIFNGTGTLSITSTDNGIVGKDDVKFTGGTYVITADSKAVEANDSIRVCGGTFSLTAGTDGLHAENDEDDTLGWISISGGTIAIRAGDDGVHGDSVVQIDGGELDISAGEGIEGTYLQINGGTIAISASDDGINAARKSDSYYPTVEITGGDITVEMGQGDTDAVDSNGDLIISGGTIDITAQSAFDFDGTVEFTGGTVIINGQQVDSIPNQMMGGGMMGGMEGGPGDGGFGGGHRRP